jgi:tRNA G37 N-methylase Trm5
MKHYPTFDDLESTRLEEAIVVEIRYLMLLPLDDLLVISREFVNSKVSRAGLNRCLTRNGIGNLKKLIAQQHAEKGVVPDVKSKKTFKDYEPGFIHIDIKYLPKMPDEDTHRYLYVAIDCATRWVHLHIYDNQTQENSVDFVNRVVEQCPVKIEKILTDNGTQFTDRFT